MQNQQIVFQVGRRYFAQINKVDVQGATQTIVVCDISGSMRSYWGSIQSTYNNLCTNLSGDVKIILFKYTAIITEHKTLPFNCATGNTNIIDALTSLEYVYDPIKYKNTNVIFVTDGEDTCNKNFNAMFEGKIKKFKSVTNHLNFYILGIGRSFPTYISQLIRNKLHTGSSAVSPLFAALNGSSEEITTKLTEIFEHLKKYSSVEISNNVFKMPYDQSYTNKVTSGDYVLFDNFDVDMPIVLNGQIYKTAIFEPTLNTLLELFSQWTSGLQTESLTKDMRNEAIILKDIMIDMYSTYTPTTNQTNLTFTDRIKLKQFKTYNNTYRQLVNLVNEIASGVKLQMLTNEKLAEKLGSVYVGKYTAKHFEQHEYTEEKFTTDKNALANLVVEKRDNLRTLVSNDERCIITLDNFYEVLSEDEFVNTLRSNMCDRSSFLKSIGITGIGVLIKVTNSIGINPWSVVINNVGKYASTISLNALEEMFDSSVVTIAIGNGKTEVVNGLIPLVTEEIADSIMLSNVFQMVCTYTIMKSFGTINYDAHLGGLSSLMSYLLGLPQSEWSDNILDKVCKTAKLYTNRKNIAKTINLIWTDPNLAVITDYKSAELEHRTESLNKILLFALTTASKDQVQKQNLMFHVMKEFIGRCLESGSKISEWFECNNTEELKLQIVYPTLEELYEENFTLDKTLHTIETKLHQVKHSAVETAETVDFSVNLNKLHELQSLSAGIINFKKLVRLCEMFGCNFGEEDYIRLIVHAFKFSDSNDRSQHVADIESSRKYIQLNIFSEILSEKKSIVTKSYLQAATTHYNEHFNNCHTHCTFPLTVSQIIKLANEKGIEVNNENFSEIYILRKNGLLSNACGAFNCKYFLQPRKDFNSHYEMIIKRPHFIHAFHETIAKFHSLPPSMIRTNICAGVCTINKESFLDATIDNAYLLTNINAFNNTITIDDLQQFASQKMKELKLQIKTDSGVQSAANSTAQSATEYATQTKPVDIIRYRCKTFTSSNCTAIAILLPMEYVQNVNQIRSLYDAAYERWMPHINLIYPFVDESEFSKVLENLSNVFKNFQPFELSLDTIDYFEQKSGSNTYHLTTSNECTQLMSIVNILHQVLPNVKRTHRFFQPHLTIGQFDKHRNMEDIQKYFGSPIKFTVDKIHIITRSKTDPFKVHTVFNFGEPVTSTSLEKLIN